MPSALEIFTPSDALFCGTFGTLFFSGAVCTMSDAFSPSPLAKGRGLLAMWRGGGGVGVRETVFGGYARSPFNVQRSPRHGHRAQERLPFTGLCFVYVRVNSPPKFSTPMLVLLPEQSFSLGKPMFRGVKP